MCIDRVGNRFALVFPFSISELKDAFDIQLVTYLFFIMELQSERRSLLMDPVLSMFR